MKERSESMRVLVPGTRRARILWRDDKTGERLWLVLTGTDEFLEELGHVGYDLERLPDSPQTGPGRRAPHAA
jgi:hypothetical protein